MASLINHYISKNLSVSDLIKELQSLMKEYKSIKQRDLFIYSVDVVKSNNPNVNLALCQEDFYIFQDILRTECCPKIDVYIETPGGSGESAEEIARFLHDKFEEVNFVIAAEAKSAGTILALSGDNILMTDTGSLGPIDAQIRIGRSQVSAYDYKEWIDEKRREAELYNKLNPLDAIIVSQISPGEIKKVINALEFAKDLVINWLVKYKFKSWTITEERQIPVTDEMKKDRASEVANALTNQSVLRTHGRSLKINDLRRWLKIERIDDEETLREVVYKIKTVIRLIYDQSSTFKLYMFGDLKILRTFASSNNNAALQKPNGSIPIPIQNSVDIGINCPKCGTSHSITAHVNNGTNSLINKNIKDNDIFTCNSCGFEINLKPIKNDLEIKLKSKIHF